ncbi:MAG TPA: helix-turn-helix transcriptional regulator [Conexibacter sp.]|nr:helix-turn-helix transcriptional regulator [Conexibacter sp.]
MPSREPCPPLGQALRERREELGLTQEALAQASGLATKRIWQIERQGANPTYSTLLSIAAALRVPAELLMLRARVIEDDRARAKNRGRR